jgi:hypothetical protein
MHRPQAITPGLQHSHSVMSAHGATYAFSQSPLSDASRSFIGPILEGSKGSRRDLWSSAGG